MTIVKLREVFFILVHIAPHGRHSGLMVSALSSGPGSRPGQGNCVVFMGKTLASQGASLHPGV